MKEAPIQSEEENEEETINNKVNNKGTRAKSLILFQGLYF